MTAQQAANAHGDSAQDAVFRDGFRHIFRTGGLVAAGRRQEWRQEPLIQVQRADYRFPHLSTNRSNSRRSSSGDACKAARRGLMTISHCGPMSCKRTRSASLIRRFTRLRVTAFPKARGTVNPSLGPSLSWRGTWRQNAAKYLLAIRVPWLYALRKSEVLRIRTRFGKPNLVGVPECSLVADR
jgi:hypothetical protein